MKIQIRRGSESNRETIIPVNGEPLFTTDTKKLYVGDGVTPGGVEVSSGGSGGGAVNSVNTKTGDVVLDKSDIGLSSVNNTADIDKPISTATQSVLDGKVDKVAGKGLSTNDYTTVEKNKVATAIQTEVDPTVPSWAKQPSKPSYNKTEIGLENVNNTSDVDKPISIATQSALNAKADVSSLSTVATTGQYSDIIGKPTVPAQFNPIAGANVTLSGTYPDITFNATGSGGGGGDMFASVYDPNAKATDAFSMGSMVETTSAKVMTSAERTKLSGVEAGAQVNTVTSVNTRTGAVSGLAEQSTLNNHTSNTSNPHSVTKAQVGLSNVDNTSDASKPVSTATQTALDGKANSSHTHPATDLTATGRTTTNFLRGDNTWAVPTNTTYSEIPSAEITAGTASAARSISGRRSAEIVKKAVIAANNYIEQRTRFP